MGSLLYDRGVLHTHSYDELNLSRPQLIQSLHQEYCDAGANILETNTFGANRLALSRHGHASETQEINERGVSLAREVAGRELFVAGAVGPSGVDFSSASPSQIKLARDALVEQMAILVNAGVDVLILETFQSLQELEEAIGFAKEHPEIPVIAQMVFTADRRTVDGLTATEVAKRLVKAGADVIGANCGIGPPELYDVGNEMVGHGAPVCIQPNAGLPSSIDGRTIYVANPEHFGVFARRMLKTGVKLVGGCCGTTPEHTRHMLGAVRMMGKPAPRSRLQEVSASMPKTAESAVKAGEEPTPLGERSRLGKRLANGEFAVSVELTSPAGIHADKFLGAVSQLLTGGVDIINIADGPRATARMGNVSVCALAREKTGIEPILHVCCRDRNYLGLVSHLLGAHALGLRDLVIITGDPPKMGDYPFATPVYDVDSIGLLQLANGFNRGVDPSGKSLPDKTNFVLATGAEPGATDYERELRRVERKRDAGAELIMTQPVYNPETLDRFLNDVTPLGLPVMVGLLPLASDRNAKFLHNEVPGMSIPAPYRKRMAAVGSGPKARAEGVAIAREALAAVKHRVAGAYIMPPFNRVESALAILEEVRGLWKPAAAAQ